MGSDPAAERVREPRSGSRLEVLGWLAVGLLALLPSLGTLGAPWISDDALILGYVHREGVGGDWFGSQYGLVTIHFWRPLVTTSWAVQERLFGTDPVPFRVLNLICHVATALIVTGIARSLGTGRFGSFVAGALVGLFPDQGGTVTWVAGRVDSLTLPFFVGSLLLAQRGRLVAAAAVAFLACACKESSFVLPGWALALSLGAGRPARRTAGSFIAVLLGTLVAFVWRRVAVGAWIGGYPTAEVDPVSALAGAASALTDALGPTLLGLVVVFLLGARSGTWRGLPFVAGLACAAGGAAPLFALLTDGVIEPQNRRTLCFADIGLCLAVGAAVATWPGELTRRGARLLGRLAVVAALALAGARGVLAWQDTHEWAAAGRMAEAAAERARAAAQAAGAGQLPLLFEGFPEVHGGAYALSYGAADRLRAPFPPSPRPVWPLRSMFRDPAHERAALRMAGGGWARPFDAALASTPPLELRRPGGGELGALRVDERVPMAEPDRSDAFEVLVPPGVTRLEILLYTEMGHEPFPWDVSARADATDSVVVERISLMHLFGTTNGRVNVGEAWIFTASLGARAAYLEVRALHGDRVVAASDWIPLVWDPPLLDSLR